MGLGWFVISGSTLQVHSIYNRAPELFFHAENLVVDSTWQGGKSCDYDYAVDIWAYGMCLMQVVFEEPLLSLVAPLCGDNFENCLSLMCCACLLMLGGLDDGGDHFLDSASLISEVRSLMPSPATTITWKNFTPAVEGYKRTIAWQAASAILAQWDPFRRPSASTLLEMHSAV